MLELRLLKKNTSYLPNIHMLGCTFPGGDLFYKKGF